MSGMQFDGALGVSRKEELDSQCSWQVLKDSGGEG